MNQVYTSRKALYQTNDNLMISRNVAWNILHMIFFCNKSTYQQTAKSLHRLSERLERLGLMGTYLKALHEPLGSIVP